MINILLFLSYTIIEKTDWGDSYFQKFSSLKYSFKKNSYFKFHFLYNQDGMVFGLATDDEIKKIEEYQYKSNYCYNSYKLSAIQFYASQGKTFEGEIPSAQILTPYAFTCKEKYTISAELEFFNGANNLDSRLQIFRIVALVYFIIVIIITIAFLIYICYYSYKQGMCLCQNNYCASFIMSLCCNTYTFYIGFFFFLFIFFTLQAYSIFEFFNARKNQEYININYEKNSEDDAVINSLVLSIISNAIVMIFLALISNFLSWPNATWCSRIWVSILLVVMGSFYLGFQLSLYDIVGAIFIVISFFIIFFISQYYLPYQFVVTRIAIISYFIGSFTAFPLGTILINELQDKISTHFFVLIFGVIFIITHAVTIVLLSLAIFRFGEFDDSVFSVIIIHQTTSITFSLESNTSTSDQSNANLIDSQNFIQ